MSLYSFLSRDPKGAIALSQRLCCRDDLAALAHGVLSSDSHAIEIFDGRRLVARVKLGNRALDVRDLHSL
jgi:hypothetical protein